MILKLFNESGNYIWTRKKSSLMRRDGQLRMKKIVENTFNQSNQTEKVLY